MPYQLSAGVVVTERDLTTIIPSIATTPGAFAGVFQWGPVLQRVLVETEQILVNEFGKPNTDTFTSFFTAANFLSYGNNLQLVRVVGIEALNACTHATKLRETFTGDGAEDTFTTVGTVTVLPAAANIRVLVDGAEVAAADYTAAIATNKLEITFDVAPDDDSAIIIEVRGRRIFNEDSLAEQTSLDASFYGKYPGVLANGLIVVAADSTAWSSLSADYKAIFQAAPTGQEIHVAVIDDGGVTGTNGTVLEKWEFLSKTEGAKKEDGSNAYYKDVLNQESMWVWSTGTLTDTTSGVATLGGGYDDNTVSVANREEGYDLFTNADEVDVSLLILGEGDATLAAYLITMAEGRKDCLAVVGPESADVVGNRGDENTDTLAFKAALSSSSYYAMDNNWKYQYDKYNDVFRWVPCNPDVAGTIVRTDNTTDPWYSPAGFNRGHIKNAVKLAYNPTQAERDELYKNNINPIVSFAGEGPVLFGDKTGLTRPSAFDRINVRRLFIILEKAIAKAAKYSLFEFNDEFTRAQFRNLVEPYLSDIQGRRGIIDFKVVCDETNNTGEVIDRNEFVGDIYIKPNRSINFIQLNFIAVRSNVTFEEIIGS